MVSDCAKLFGTDCAISTTGIAGPNGGTPEKPVGLVYVGILTPMGTKVYRQVFSGTRQDIRHRTLMFALTQLLLGITKDEN
jgi:nicotinamide-nucleotide amidase